MLIRTMLIKGYYLLFYALEPSNPNYDINSFSDDYDPSESGFLVHSKTFSSNRHRLVHRIYEIFQNN